MRSDALHLFLKRRAKLSKTERMTFPYNQPFLQQFPEYFICSRTGYAHVLCKLPIIKSVLDASKESIFRRFLLPVINPISSSILYL